MICNKYHTQMNTGYKTQYQSQTQYFASTSHRLTVISSASVKQIIHLDFSQLLIFLHTLDKNFWLKEWACQGEHG